MLLKITISTIIFSFTLYGCTQHLETKNENIPINTEKSLSLKEFDELFEEIEFDTLHIYPTAFEELKLIEDEHIPSFMNYELDSGNYYPVYKFDMGTDIAQTAYLVLFTGISGNTEIYLHIYSTEKQDFIFSNIVASYMLLETAYEELKNCWITDLDNNKGKDIAIYYQLIDFELPNEYSDNASRSENFIYYFKENKYEYNYWPDDVLTTIRIKH